MAKSESPKFRKLALALSGLALLATASPANAQAVLDQQTGIADPSRNAERFLNEDLLPAPGPSVDVKGLQVQGAPAGAENIRFILNTISFSGADAMTDAQLRSAYGDYVGTEITLAELYGIANRITATYRNNGYILTRVVVPPQTIDGGNVRLQVVEGYINRIVIQSDEAEGPALDTIRDYASHISSGGALNVKALERELLLINDLPGVSARTVLSPSNVPGAADMLIIVERDPWDAVVSVDNYGSRYLGPWEVGAAGTLNSALGFNEAITAQVVVAPQSWYELAYGALSYEQPIGKWGTKFKILGASTFTDPGYDLAQFDVKGQSDLVSLQLTHPFIRTRNQNLEGRLTFDARNVESSNNIQATRHDRIRALRAGGRFDFVDRLLSPAQSVIDVEVSQGLNIFGASEEGRANLTRAAGDPQFTKINGEIQRLQRLTDTFNLFLAGRGQWSANPLLASEEFAVGGIGIGRGYDPSEITGDDGVSGKVELQWNSPYAVESTLVENYQIFSFLDYGKVWDQDATTSGQVVDSLTSAGAGMRIGLVEDVQFDFAVAFPLSTEVQTQNDKGARFLVGASKRF